MYLSFMKKQDTIICNKCKKEKPSDQFYKSDTTLSGRRNKCIDCVKEYNAEYRAQTKENQPKRRSTLSSINNRAKAKKYEQTATKILNGELEDDFTNHFFSHFGFNDIAHDQDRENQMPTQTQSARGYNLKESYGIGTRYKS